METDVIHLLPDSVANQIAAGEVIQRPASVIKELVENSIDAGATSVDIIVKDAGRTLIQVVDNGCGMSATDARLAFERHATSKISKADDLYTLHTMGFRGEALPSVAAVSEIEMCTMRATDTIGTCIKITASHVKSQEPTATVPGTSIMVKHLFFNLPARRKFLKNDATEFNHILREFERLALVNINVDLSLTHNDTPVKLLRRATLKQRIADLFGSQLTHQILPVGCDTSLARISGFVGLPQNARRRSPWQFFFVNGRNMRHPFFHKAVTQCYDELIAADMQPNYFINIDVDPATIDVNVHPQKHEIKFENEQSIRQILVAAVKEALGSFNAAPAIDFDRDDAPDIPVFNPAAGGNADIDVDPHYNPFNTDSQPTTTPSRLNGESTHASSGGFSNYRPSALNTDWQKLYDSFLSKKKIDGSNIETPAQTFAATTLPDSTRQVPEQTTLPDDETNNNVGSIMQLHGRYIITSTRSGLMIIDMRRAHILILYNQYLDMACAGKIASQRVMFAEQMNLDPARSLVLNSILPVLTNMGFDLRQSTSSPGRWTVEGVPSVIRDCGSAVPTLNDIIDNVSAGDTDTRGIARSQTDDIALSMARAAAIKRGTQITAAEAEKIVADLMKLSTPTYTPDGLLVMRLLTIDEINKLFDRQ